MESTWKLEMQGEFEIARRNCSYNIERLLITLENIAKKHFGAGDMPEKSEFQFPTTDGLHYSFRFFKDYTEIDQIGKNGQSLPLLQPNQYTNTKAYKQAQSLVLATIGQTLHLSDNHLGEMFPQRLAYLLREMQPGTIVSFTDGRSYLCKEVDKPNDTIKLVQLFSGTLLDLSLETISKTPQVEVCISRQSEIQKFYNDNCKNDTQRMEFTLTFQKTAIDVINKIEDKVVNEKVPLKLDMGNVKFIATPGRHGAVWHDNSGNAVNKKTVIIMRSLMNAQLYKRLYIRKKPSNIDIANDQAFERRIENLSSQYDFITMHDLMLKYVREHKNNLVIETLQFEKNENDFTPARIVFAERDGRVGVFKITYKDNNFNNEEDKVTQLSPNEFVELCKQVYNENHHSMLTRTEEMIKDAIKTRGLDKTDVEINTIIARAKNLVENKNANVVIGTNIQDDDKKRAVMLVQSYLGQERQGKITAKEIEDELGIR